MPLRYQQWWLAAVILAACGEQSSSDEDLVGLGWCVPGRELGCECESGSLSIRICGDDHRYGECQCAFTGSGGSTSSGGSTGTSKGGSTSSARGGASARGGSDAGGSAGAPVSDYEYGDLEPCPAGGNVLFFDGDSGDYIHSGRDLITAATFTEASNTDHVGFDITPDDEGQGLWWWLDFSSEELAEPLAVGEYLDAERYPFEAAQKPGLDVSGDGRGCNMLSGKFLIDQIDWQGNALVRFRAAFEQHCEQGTAALRGCINYEAGSDPGSAGAAGAGGGG